MRYRRAFADQINNLELDNTGGRWINVIQAGIYHRFIRKHQVQTNTDQL